MTEPTKTFDVVGIGECLVAFNPVATGPLFAPGIFEAHVAGAEANVCVGVARLDHRAAFVGRVSGDALGDAILRQLRMEGVDVSGVLLDADAPTAVQIRERRGFGTSEFLYYRRDSAGARLTPEDVRRCEHLIADARWLHLSGITPALSDEACDALTTAVEVASAAGVRISFDVNLRTKVWEDLEHARPILLEIAANSDVVFAGLAEAEFLVGAGSAEALGERLTAAVREGGTVVLKLGRDGAMLFPTDGHRFAAPAFAVERVIDVVGAGDAFAAGFLSGCLDGLDGPASLLRANACGAFAVAVRGDMRGLPKRYEVERFAMPVDEVLR